MSGCLFYASEMPNKSSPQMWVSPGYSVELFDDFGRTPETKGPMSSFVVFYLVMLSDLDYVTLMVDEWTWKKIQNIGGMIMNRRKPNIKIASYFN